MKLYGDYLNHYGILGMHWGKRRGSSTFSKSKTTKPKKPDNSSDDHKEAQAIKKKKVNEMSNAELKTLNNRLQLEKQYRDLSKRQVSSGEKIAADILINGGKQTATNLVAKGMAKGVEAAINYGTQKRQTSFDYFD